jgi:hypothetical protein
MAKNIRELLPEGKIIGFQHNNLWFGEKPKTVPAASLKRAAKSVREDADNYDINLYLAYLDRDTAPDDFVPLPKIVGQPPYTEDYYTTPLSLTIDMFVDDYVHDWDDPSIVYDRSCVGTTDHQATLMDVIILAFEKAGSFITDLDLTSDTQPQENTIPDWLQGFSFHDSATYEQNRFYSDYEMSDPYEIDGHLYVDYTGWDWMYFIGTPQSQPFNYVGALSVHGSPFPKLRLDEFPVGAVPIDENGRNFTLVYVKQTQTFQLTSETVNGETVHTLIKPDAFK